VGRLNDDNLPDRWRGPRSPKRQGHENRIDHPSIDPNANTITRIVELLHDATYYGKIHWFRDSESFAVTYFPMLAASFRIQIGGSGYSHSQGGDVFTVGSTGPLNPERCSHMTIAFIDNKEFRCLGHQYPKLHELSKLVWSKFQDEFLRERSERLEWLEKALRMFLPMVISSDVEPE